MNELRNLCVRARIRKGLGFRSLLIVSLSHRSGSIGNGVASHWGEP